jgi:hypothetical protein
MRDSVWHRQILLICSRLAKILRRIELVANIPFSFGGRSCPAFRGAGMDFATGCVFVKACQMRRNLSYGLNRRNHVEYIQAGESVQCGTTSSHCISSGLDASF